MSRPGIVSRSILPLVLILALPARAEDGYDLWLRYQLVSDDARLHEYRTTITQLVMHRVSPTLESAHEEVRRGLLGLLGREIHSVRDVSQDGALVAGTPTSSQVVASLRPDGLAQAGEDGFVIETTWVDGKHAIVIAGNSDIGVLYGVFHFLRLLQTHQDISELGIVSSPRIQHRLLNHWDNLDRTVERGYAGFSLWDWHKLPDYIDPRYVDYARANASIGINGTVLTNVNANALVLAPMYLDKAAALADVFRPYGIRVYLTARFSAPMEIGDLETADPLDENVRSWWRLKAEEIYTRIPDFGGFLVKANSEGQPGPQDYGRSHADGANMLADAVDPHNGVVMWRAFVYSAEEPVDRAKQAYNEFVPLDGTFRSNVLIQAKNGPIDFQPREPFHPLFGALPKTPVMMEFQITKEYLGFATHLAYLAPLFKEVLTSDTYARGRGSSVASVVDGSLHRYDRTGIAGVSNIGSDRNWTGSHFDQANWYAFGRLAWDHTLSSDRIAEEWIRQTFSNDTAFIDPVKSMMMGSREAVVNYMTPLGLHHLMARGHHYGPGPWVEGGPRADWTSVYYHRADSLGIGFDRTMNGSDAVSQYFHPLDSVYGNVATVPESLLLWFHHVRWDHTMKSGRSLWEELGHHYYRGVDEVTAMRETWASVRDHVDDERFAQVKAYLAIQEKEAIWWRNASVLYFQSFSKRPIPEHLERPAHSLDYYRNLSFPFAPGN